MNKTAIVMGATGLIGRHLVDELIASPRFSKVVALTRKPLSITSEKFENHIVDFEHLEDYSELLSADALFFLVVPKHEKKASQWVRELNKTLSAARAVVISVNPN